jgi:hypothetical protein
MLSSPYTSMERLVRLSSPVVTNALPTWGADSLPSGMVGNLGAQEGVMGSVELEIFMIVYSWWMLLLLTGNHMSQRLFRMGRGNVAYFLQPNFF